MHNGHIQSGTRTKGIHVVVLEHWGLSPTGRLFKASIYRFFRSLGFVSPPRLFDGVSRSAIVPTIRSMRWRYRRLRTSDVRSVGVTHLTLIINRRDKA